MQQALALFFALAIPTLAGAQTPGSHANSGEFKQPTPADRFRQNLARNNLAHPPGYVTAPLGTFGEIAERGENTEPGSHSHAASPGW